jgi:hypothetical protein
MQHQLQPRDLKPLPNGSTRLSEGAERLLAAFRQKYIDKGYLNAGAITFEYGLSAGFIGQDFEDLLEAGWIRERTSKQSYVLVTEERFRLIVEHDLSVEWEKIAPHFSPNDPEEGEIALVKRELRDAAAPTARDSGA